MNNPELLSAVDGVVRPALEHWLNHNISVAEAIVARIILAARAREASRAAQAEVSRKSATSTRLNLPGKLSDCTNPTSEGSELFVVEGDSAGGSAKQGRDRTRQAILPLRGKVLNTESASLAKVLENKELSDLVTAIGCGLGKNFDLARLRYGKIIILADADSDGNHIATLLLTFIYRHLPQLMTSGKVFLAQPPLYRIDIGKDTFWALDDAHRDRLLKQHGKNGGRAVPEITRFKGLGEMMPKVLWETTLNPRTRRLLRVEIGDQIVTDRVINELMGKDASARFRFIMERAEEAEELDVYAPRACRRARIRRGWRAVLPPGGRCPPRPFLSEARHTRRGSSNRRRYRTPTRESRQPCARGRAAPPASSTITFQPPPVSRSARPR